MTDGDQILKSDARGRVRVPVERQEALLDEFERSGLSGVKFAKLVGVKYPTFALWVQKRRRARAALVTEDAGFRSERHASRFVCLKPWRSQRLVGAVSC